jgi:hypothetical protein
LVNYFKDFGFSSRRSLQAMGGSGQPDVVVDEEPLKDVHIEGKRYKRMAIYKHAHQAERDSGHRPWWWVVVKADREEPLAVMPLDFAVDMAVQLREFYQKEDNPSGAEED